jgi:hypothetical protein
VVASDPNDGAAVASLPDVFVWRERLSDRARRLHRSLAADDEPIDQVRSSLDEIAGRHGMSARMLQ